MGILATVLQTYAHWIPVGNQVGVEVLEGMTKEPKCPVCGGEIWVDDGKAYCSSCWILFHEFMVDRIRDHQREVADEDLLKKLEDEAGAFY